MARFSQNKSTFRKQTQQFCCETFILDYKGTENQQLFDGIIDVTLFDGVEELDLCKQCFYDLKNCEATAEHFDRHHATFPSKEPCTVISELQEKCKLL